jgi:hypothetical protein
LLSEQIQFRTNTVCSIARESTTMMSGILHNS